MPIIPPASGGSSFDGANKSLSNLIETAIVEDLNFTVANKGLKFSNDLTIKSAGTGLLIQSIIDDVNYSIFMNPTGKNISIVGLDILMNSKKIKGLALATDDTDATNKKYVDDEIKKIPAPVVPIVYANRNLSNLEAVAANQDLTFDKVNPRVLFGNNPDGGIDFSRYAIEEDENKLSIYEIDNGETGIQINPASIVLETVDGVDLVNKKLLRVLTPTADSDAANKKYVDDKNPIQNTSITLGDNIQVSLSQAQSITYYVDIGLKTLKNNLNEIEYNSAVPINIHSFSVGKMYNSEDFQSNMEITMQLRKKSHYNNESELLYSLVLDQFVRSHTFVLPEPLLIDNSADFDYYWQIITTNLSAALTVSVSLMTSVEYSAAGSNPIPE